MTHLKTSTFYEKIKTINQTSPALQDNDTLIAHAATSTNWGDENYFTSTSDWAKIEYSEIDYYPSAFSKYVIYNYSFFMGEYGTENNTGTSVGFTIKLVYSENLIIDVGSMNSGSYYEIVNQGTGTNWTNIGAASESVGTNFIYNGVSTTGNGKVKEWKDWEQNTLCYIGSQQNTYVRINQLVNANFCLDVAANSNREKWTRNRSIRLDGQRWHISSSGGQNSIQLNKLKKFRTGGSSDISSESFYNPTVTCTSVEG